MNLGIYYAFWEKNWEADYLLYIDKVKKLGFDTLEIAAGCLVEMSDSNLIKIANHALRAGINLTFCIGLPSQYDISSEDETTRKNGVEFVRKILRAIHIMRGNMLGGIIYGSWPSTIESCSAKAVRREKSILSVKSLATVAADYGITYCLEIVNRFEQFLLNTAQEGLDYIQEVCRDNVKLLLDTFHMNIEEDDMIHTIVRCEGKIGHFHVGERNRKPPGLGNMPWKEIFSALKKIHYDGAVVMEPFMKPGGEVGRDIHVYRDLSFGASPEAMDLMAKNSVNYLRNFIV